MATPHTEKIDHVVNKLSAAGLGDSTSTSSTSSHSSHHSSDTKWIIIGSVVGAVVLLIVLFVGVMLYRRFRRKRAYNMVSKGVDMRQGNVVPAWQTAEHQPEVPRPLMLGAEGSAGRSRRLSSVGDEVFNADREVEHSEHDSMMVEGQTIHERNFESGYDTVDTGYDGAGYSKA